jgi:hypothetical protein
MAISIFLLDAVAHVATSCVPRAGKEGKGAGAPRAVDLRQGSGATLGLFARNRNPAPKSAFVAMVSQDEFQEESESTEIRFVHTLEKIFGDLRGIADRQTQ